MAYRGALFTGRLQALSSSERLWGAAASDECTWFRFSYFGQTRQPISGQTLKRLNWGSLFLFGGLMTALNLVGTLPSSTSSDPFRFEASWELDGRTIKWRAFIWSSDGALVGSPGG